MYGFIHQFVVLYAVSNVPIAAITLSLHGTPYTYFLATKKWIKLVYYIKGHMDCADIVNCIWKIITGVHRSSRVNPVIEGIHLGSEVLRIQVKTCLLWELAEVVKLSIEHTNDL